MVEIVTLGRFEIRFQTPRGSSTEYAPASAALLKFLLCSNDARAFNVDAKSTLWPPEEIGRADGLEAARISEGNFGSARGRLDEWFREHGAPGLLLIERDSLRLDLTQCTVDAIEADTTLGAIIRGELGADAALAAIEAFDKPFLPAEDGPSRGSAGFLGPSIIARRNQLVQRVLFATAAALRASITAQAADAAAFAALLSRAHSALERAQTLRARQAAEALEAAIAETKRKAPVARPAASSSARLRNSDHGATLVGRARELGELRAILSDTRRALVLVVEGPPGAGATTLVQTVARELANSGERVVFDLTAAPHDDAPDDAPSRAVLSAAEAIGPVAGAAALQPIARELLGTVSQLAPWFNDLRGRAPKLDDRQRALRLGQAVRLLDGVRAALAIVDRCDLNDAASERFAAELLHQVALYRDTIRLAVVLTARPGDRKTRRLRLDNVERMTVDRLDTDASRELAARLAPRGADIERIVQLADGLPAVIAQLAIARNDDERRRFTDQRLGHLTADARHLIFAFARAQAPVAFHDAVAEAGGKAGDDRWFDALEDLQTGGWIDAREGGYVVRETLLAQSLREL